MDKIIDLFYWPTPNGWKVSIALEEMKLPFKTHEVNISKGDQFEKTFLDIAPNNRIPAIKDYQGPEGQEISLFESGANSITIFPPNPRTSNCLGSSLIANKFVLREAA